MAAILTRQMSADDLLIGGTPVVRGDDGYVRWDPLFAGVTTILYSFSQDKTIRMHGMGCGCDMCLCYASGMSHRQVADFFADGGA